MLLYGTTAFILTFTFIISLLAYYNDDDARQTAAVLAFVFLEIFSIAHSFTWTPLNCLYVVEILPYEVRARGMAFMAFLLFFLYTVEVIQMFNAGPGARNQRVPMAVL
jgi:hypothetical protein